LDVFTYLYHPESNRKVTKKSNFFFYFFLFKQREQQKNSPEEATASFFSYLTRKVLEKVSSSSSSVNYLFHFRRMVLISWEVAVSLVACFSRFLPWRRCYRDRRRREGRFCCNIYRSRWTSA